MLTVNVTKEIKECDLFELVEILIDEGLKSIEVDIITDTIGKLLLCLNMDVESSQSDPVFVNELFKFISCLDGPIEIILNLKELNLESRALFLAEKWGLTRQVKYSGVIEPSHLSLWDRIKVIYNIENCLPNMQKLSHLKEAHLDVANYFCTKYQVKMIRIPAYFITEEVLTWCAELTLELSVMDAETIEAAEALGALGIAQISVNNIQAFLKSITH